MKKLLSLCIISFVLLATVDKFFVVMRAVGRRTEMVITTEADACVHVQKEMEALKEKAKERELSLLQKIDSLQRSMKMTMLRGGSSDDEEEEELEAFKKKAMLREQELIREISNLKESFMNNDHLFGPETSAYAAGAVTIKRDEFVKKFDYGLPVPLSDMVSRDPQFGSEEVLVIYPNEESKPTPEVIEQHAVTNRSSQLPLLGVNEAFAKCERVNAMYVMAVEYPCLAIMKGFGSYHLLKWEQEKEEESGEPTGEFNRVAMRGSVAGVPFLGVPDEIKSTMHRQTIQRYLNNLDDVLEELRPIVERVSTNNALSIMTGNMGYMPFIMNFICSARARNIDLSNVLIFTTDKESADAIGQMGVATFHTEKILGELPKKEAEIFMDQTFNLMTFAQIASVHMVNMLGYDVLFQDADVIWYQDPLPYFFDDSRAVNKYEVIFMDDGVNHMDYQPWRANTGLYFVRNTQNTRYLLSELLFSGDVVGVYGNDQGVMSVLLNEHSAKHGLQVTTLPWHDFPGGREYHHNAEFVNDVIDGKENIWTWHMHWALNRDLKVQYMEQSGWWFLNEQCANKPLDEILQEEGMTDLTSHCCSAEAVISCHFDDKPSAQICRKIE